MTQRNEPTVGTSAFDMGGLFSFPKTKSKTPDQLVVEALQGFTDAQAKLEAAQAAISNQIAEHDAEIQARQAKLDTAKESHSRLDRIKGRFADLLA